MTIEKQYHLCLYWFPTSLAYPIQGRTRITFSRYPSPAIKSEDGGTAELTNKKLNLLTLTQNVENGAVFLSSDMYAHKTMLGLKHLELINFKG